MIHLSCFTCSRRDLDALHEGASLNLGELELAEYERFTVPKRKDEFIASRVAIKDLVISCSAKANNLHRNEIQVVKESSGLPFLVVKNMRKLPGWISLSHSEGCVFSGFSSDDLQFGVDVEHIEPRSDEFIEDFFTDTEQDYFSTLNSGEKPFYATLAWSAKEALLKACAIGLRVDTRTLEANFPLPARNENGWNHITMSSFKLKIPASQLLWMRKDDYILSVCVLDSLNPSLMLE